MESTHATVNIVVDDSGSLTMWAIVENNSTTRLRIIGVLDLATGDRVGALLADAAVGPSKCVSVDVSQVSFIDVAGLRALLRGRDAAQTTCDVHFVVPRVGPVRRLLDLTGLASELIDV